MKNLRIPSLFLLLLLAPVMPAAASGDGYGGGVAVTELARTSVTADGRPVAYPRTDRPEVTALLVEIPPGGETGWHLHPVPVYAYIISGVLEVEMDGATRTYHEGEVIIEAVGTPQNGRNRGTTPVRLVAFYTGEQGKPSTQKVEGGR